MLRLIQKYSVEYSSVFNGRIASIMACMLPSLLAICIKQLSVTVLLWTREARNHNTGGKVSYSLPYHVALAL